MNEEIKEIHDEIKRTRLMLALLVSFTVLMQFAILIYVTKDIFWGWFLLFMGLILLPFQIYAVYRLWKLPKYKWRDK